MCVLSEILRNVYIFYILLQSLKLKLEYVCLLLLITEQSRIWVEDFTDIDNDKAST